MLADTRARSEAFLYDYLNNTYTKEEVLEMLVYQLSDTEIKDLVRAFAPPKINVVYVPKHSYNFAL